MEDKMYKLRDMICMELDKIADKGTLTKESLDNMDKLTHSLKSIDTVMAMEDAYDDEGYSGARRYPMRDSYGRYSGRGSDRSYDRGGYAGRRNSTRRGYSGDDDREGMIAMMQDMYDRTSDGMERETIRKMIDQFR